MKYALKKTFLYIFGFTFSIIAFLSVYLFMSWFLPYLKLTAVCEPPEKGIEIFIQSNGVHTDFVLPVRTELLNWNKLVLPSDFELADSSYQYISFGWGDKGFFLNTPTWADLKFSTAFKAAFGLSSTAMHVAYKRNKPNAGELTRKLVISEKQYARLVFYILSSFQAAKGKLILIDHAGYTLHDRFYEGIGTYTMFTTCNVWTGNGLRFIGGNIGAWTPFHKGVIDHCE